MALETWQRLSPQRSERLDAAIDCYLRRQARRINPEGYFNNARRWHPSETENKLAAIRFVSPAVRIGVRLTSIVAAWSTSPISSMSICVFCVGV